MSTSSFPPLAPDWQALHSTLNTLNLIGITLSNDFVIQEVSPYLLRFTGWQREELIARCHAASPLWSEAELGPWADSKKRVSVNVLNRAEDAPLEWGALLPRITCPVQAVYGQEDVLYRGLWPQVAACFGGRLQLIAGAGHWVQYEQPGVFAEAVLPMLL